MNTDNVPSTTEEAPAGKRPKLAEPRVKDGEQGHAIFRKLDTDDEDAAWKRGNIDDQIDGGLPFDEAALIEAGRGEDANVNFMEAKAEDDNAQMPFIEMTTNTRVLWNVRTDYGTAQEQKRYSQTISEELTRTAREWGEDFDYFRLRLAQQFTRHGVGFLYWEDELNWQFRSDGLDAFKIPRNVESRSGAIPYAMCKRTMSVDALYAFIRKEKAAEAVGRWNIDAVKQALCDAACTGGGSFTERWPEFLRQIKENDVTIGATKPEVKVYHLWVPEFNGRISHYIGLQKGACTDSDGKVMGTGPKAGFLYANRSRFTKMARCVIPFFYGIGTHGTVHTVRGQGELNFAPIAISNQARCKMYDGAQAASAILLQAGTPADAENTAYIRRGPFIILSGNSKVEPTAMPDVGQRMLPVLRDSQTLRQNLTGSFQARAITEEGTQERTKYEVQAQQQQGGTLESTRLTLFLGPWGRAGHEMFRRLMDPKQSDKNPGGPEALDFRKRCMKRGVPKEALASVYSVEAVRTIGYGSPAARQSASEEIYKVSGGFDEVGRKRSLRDLIASIPGVDYQTADAYVGEDDEVRMTVDDQIAELENNDFRNGQKVRVTDGQLHWTHCQHHIPLVQETVKAFEAGQIEGAQLVPILSAALDNMLQHSEQLNLDPMRQKEAAYVRKFIQQNNGTLEQQENKLIAEMQRQQEDQQAGGEQQMTGDEMRAWQAHELEMQAKQDQIRMRQQEFMIRMAELEQEKQAKKIERDLKLGADLAVKRAKFNGATA